MKTKIHKVISVISLLCIIQPAWSYSEYELGINDYKRKDFRGSLAHFQKALKANPNDANGLYYEAICYHQLKLINEAKITYAKIIQTFPTSDAAKNAEHALAIMDPKYLERIKPNSAQVPSTSTAARTDYRSYGGSQSGSGSDLDKLPFQTRIHFENEGQNYLIDAYLNNRPIKMFFDTGAEDTVFGKNNLDELHIKGPEGKASGLAGGVGSGGPQRTWSMAATIKVGEIERKNFPISVLENLGTYPLLGQSFFKDFTYRIDNGAKQIVFVRRSSGAAVQSASTAPDPNAIPFTRAGRNILITAEVNGKKIPMILDTGAEICTFTEDQLKRLGMQVPEDAQEAISSGVAGSTASRNFTVQRIKVGPVEQSEVNVSVVQNMQIPYPLLGNSFFGSMRLEVDNQANVVRIRR